MMAAPGGNDLQALQPADFALLSPDGPQTAPDPAQAFALPGDTNVVDTNVVDTNAFILPTDTVDTNLQPGDFEIPEKTPEELEYERKLEEFNNEVQELVKQGFIQGKMNPEDLPDEESLSMYDTTQLIHPDGTKIDFYRKKEEEPVVDPINTIDPKTDIVVKPKITRGELSEIIKKAIKEIKRENNI